MSRIRATPVCRAAAMGWLFLAGLVGSGPAWADDASTMETIIFVRHGEKPAEGLGQLDCQGLNRALKLPAVLAKKFGRPYAIFAPDPRIQVEDEKDKFFYYVRPLVTIEPTAIRLGMPVDTEFGYTEIDKLRAELLDPKYKGRTIFVAWEHKQLNKMVKDMISQVHGTATVPDWPGTDFDRIYKLHVSYGMQNKVEITLRQDSEGLNNQPTTCPGP